MRKFKAILKVILCAILWFIFIFFSAYGMVQFWDNHLAKSFSCYMDKFDVFLSQGNNFIIGSIIITLIIVLMVLYDLKRCKEDKGDT